MIEFILNDVLIKTNSPPGLPLLDFIRQEMGLMGTKIACREGDCGACTLMVGELDGDKVSYKTIVSCLTPLVNVQSKHVVSIEGLNGDQLSHVQQAIVDHSGTQCGFCTPGFVISLMTKSLSDANSNLDETLASVDGNICRCTGYKSIERAVKDIWEVNQRRKDKDAPQWMVKNKYLPEYFLSIHDRLSNIILPDERIKKSNVILGGGTDLMVQKADSIMHAGLQTLREKDILHGIMIEDDHCILQAGATVTELLTSLELRSIFPGIQKYFKLLSSTQIRNMGTLGGNIVNASPIGDLIVFFLALDAKLQINSPDGGRRSVALKDFYLDYKKIDLKQGEYVEALSFNIPLHGYQFNFEKVSKREHLDIASVNSAILLHLQDNLIKDVRLSAGGVGPIPMFLEKTSSFLQGRRPDVESLSEANSILQDEISPIDDIRGSEEYKRLLLRQLFIAHFIELCPDQIRMDQLQEILIQI
ncbi:MAG: 2Fe-2S iron-sulfur cluster binding domain-containing protein [Bacteroidetes bacterium]|nr:2Fe-2S iron-sulfur cluster binding domain-containing protein [Bacteroidota bacterium]MBT5425836.1 2Fe-2S iron-sulfur cluster binding domain-containing protein [Bacteroidota bacterium]MBT7464055.1 2Fe-2S iron-sulfur cluster binding domain-containing protein [Bacteroidota bacterium]